VNKILFRGARLKYFVGRDTEAGFVARIHVTADFTDPVREAMSWGEPADGFSSGKLDGELNATHFILTPNQRELKQHELQLDVVKVDDFQFFRVKSEGGGDTEEVRFVIHSAVEGAAGLVEQYIRRIGTSEKSGGQLRVNYEVQGELPLEGGGCEDCANNVPLQAGDDEVHASGRRCLKKLAENVTKTEGAPLASAREAAGGTHQKRARGPAVVQ